MPDSAQAWNHQYHHFYWEAVTENVREDFWLKQQYGNIWHYLSQAQTTAVLKSKQILRLGCNKPDVVQQVAVVTLYSEKKTEG